MKTKQSVVKVMPPQKDDESIAELMEKILLKIGEDPERQGLLRTPHRARKALRFLTSGYETDVHSIVNGIVFIVGSRAGFRAPVKRSENNNCQ